VVKQERRKDLSRVSRWSRDADFAPEQYLRAAEASRESAGRNCLVADAPSALEDADGKDLGALLRH
jgi:hypothetical protein